MHREVASGSLAAGFTATLFSPLELVKTRMQVQELPGWPRLYPNFVRALQTIAAEDGLRLLWTHGFAGFVGRDLAYSGLRIGLYPTMRESISGRRRGEASLLEKIAAGASTGVVGAAIANPLDVVRVRMSCEGGVVAADGVLATGMRAGHAPRWRSSLHCLVDCFEREGVAGGLYRGVGATTARAALLSAGQLASYDHSKTLLLRHGWVKEEGRPLHVIAAIISGVVASVCCNPADVLKSALMSARGGGRGAAADGGRGAAADVSAYGVARTIMRTQGPLGFMRGWPAAYARAGPAFFIQVRAPRARRPITLHERRSPRHEDSPRHTATSSPTHRTSSPPETTPAPLASQMPIVEELRRRFGCEAL